MVDRIGKGGTPPPTNATNAGATGDVRSPETGKTFEVQKPTAPGQAQPLAPVASEPLQQLKAGKIDLNQYLELKVSEATQHLEGVSKVQLDSIRAMLRDRLATDPELVDLVKQATGNVPSTDE
jgi:hypothetical protein